MDILEFISSVREKTLDKSVSWDKVDNDSYRLIRTKYSIFVSKYENTTMDMFSTYRLKILNGLDVMFDRTTSSDSLLLQRNEIDTAIVNLYSAIISAKTEELNKQLKDIVDML